MTVEWRGPEWLKPFFSKADDTIFHRVTAVNLQERCVPDALLQLRYLERLQLSWCQISGDQLRQLGEMHSLESLTHNETHVTEESAMVLAAKTETGSTFDVHWKSAATEPWPCLGESKLVAFACPTSAPNAK